MICGDRSDYERDHASETPGDAILLAETMVPGGRVELPTPAFSGPRSTGELPRHKGRQKILRVQEMRSKGKKMEVLKISRHSRDRILKAVERNSDLTCPDEGRAGRTTSVWMSKAFRP